MQQRCALVVEDDPDIGSLLASVLDQAGFDVTVAADGYAALDAFAELDPELITLDLTLPGVDGFELCRRMRRTSDAYVMMLTARHDEVDRLMGLEIGADDYMTKPFSTRELRARVSALYRRPARIGEEPTESTAGDAVIDGGAGLLISAVRRDATIDGSPVSLTRTEFDLLHHLARHAGVVQDRGALVREVWRGDEHGPGHLVDVHVANLRRKLQHHSRVPWIATVRGVGYRFDRAT